MMNEVPRAYLHRKLFSEQMNFRRWLLEQPPAIVLKFAREYVMREAILTSFGEITFPDGFASTFAEKPEQMKNAYQTVTRYGKSENPDLRRVLTLYGLDLSVWPSAHDG